MRPTRDLLPRTAVPCHLSGGLVDYHERCRGEGTRTGRPCGFYQESYKCAYILGHP